MMQKILATALACALSASVWAASPAAAKKPAARKTGATTSRSTSSRTATARGKKPAAPPRTTWRNRQTAPSPERYKEIQDALVAKGYLSPEAAGGAWGESSTDALKRFQADQKIDSNGKINSISLIALGLGPKRENPAPPDPPKPDSPVVR